MRDLNDLGVSYSEAMESFQAAINDAHRQWAAKVLVSYPRREDLEVTAEALLHDLGADGVEVNSIADRSQETLVKAPSGPATNVPMENSLCVIAVGLGTAAQFADVPNSSFLPEDHAIRRRKIQSWASAPIMIDGVAAGTVCAIETEHTRDWTEGDQLLLEKAASMISDQVTHWADGQRHRIG